MLLSARIVDDPAEFERLAVVWDQLALETEFVDIYATSGFARAWWKAYGANRTLRLVIIEDDAGVRLIAPFYFDHAEPSILKLVGSFRADYSNVIARAGDTESIRRLFTYLGQFRDWSVLMLSNVPGHAAVLGHFSHACSPHAGKLTKLRCWLSLGRPLAFREIRHLHPRIDSARLGELRGMLDDRSYRKHVNWFARQGTLRYAALTEPEDLARHVDAFMDLHVREWTARQGRSLFLDPENRQFYHFLLEDLRASGALRLHTLTLDDRLIAAHFGFEWNRRVYYYKPCYEPEFGSHSPGRVLLAHIIRDAVDRGLEEVDMLYGAEPYKMQLATDVRETGSLILHRSRLQTLARRVSPRRGEASRSSEGS